MNVFDIYAIRNKTVNGGYEISETIRLNQPEQFDSRGVFALMQYEYEAFHRSCMWSVWLGKRASRLLNDHTHASTIVIRCPCKNSAQWKT